MNKSKREGVSKFSVSVLAVLWLAAFSHSLSTPSSVPSPEPSPVVVQLPPTPGKLPGYNVTFKLMNAYAVQAGVLIQAQTKLTDTIKSQCFGDFMLARALVQTNQGTSTLQLNNAAVLDKIRTSQGVVPVWVYHQPWYKPTSAVGYRLDGEIDIHVRDTQVTASSKPCDVASLVGHEAIGHAINLWDHSYYWTPSRDYTVPYSINAAFTACCK